MHRASQTKRRDRIKEQTLREYGARCVRCGIDDPDVLVMDHVHNDGAEDRKYRGAKDIWERLRSLGYPKDRYQILCTNCNQKKMVRERRRKVNQNLARHGIPAVKGPS